MVSFHFIEHSHYFLILHCVHLFVSFFLTSLKNCSRFRPHRRWIFPSNHSPSATNVKWCVKGFKEKVHFYPLTLHQITTNLMDKEAEEVFKSLWPHNTSPPPSPNYGEEFYHHLSQVRRALRELSQVLFSMSFRGDHVLGFLRDY